MGFISDYFHPERSYQKAEEGVRQGWEGAQGYQKPYWQNGLDQYQNLSGAENQLLNPAELQDKWAAGYQQSPYARQMLEQNKTSGLDAASSMGLMGSSAALQNIQTGAGNIVNQDRQQYMNDLMQKYMQGIGIGKDVYGIGAQTGQNLGNQSMQYGQDLAGLRYGQQEAKNQFINKLLAMAGGSYFNGGNVSPSSGGAPVSEISQWAV